MAPVSLTVVGNELEAEMLCGELRANGIECLHRSADFLAPTFGSAVDATVFGQAARTEVFVDETDLERAKKLLSENR